MIVAFIYVLLALTFSALGALLFMAVVVNAEKEEKATAGVSLCLGFTVLIVSLLFAYLAGAQ